MPKVYPWGLLGVSKINFTQTDFNTNDSSNPIERPEEIFGGLTCILSHSSGVVRQLTEPANQCLGASQSMPD